MDKEELSKKILSWLKKQINLNLKEDYDLVDIFIPESILSKLPNQYIKSMPNYSSWSFKPDVLAILKNKTNNKIEFILSNRSVSALSLKEIGELHCYSKVMDPIFSFLFSLNGVSNEVNILLLDQKIQEDLLNFNDKKTITILTWDAKKDEVNFDSIIPFDKKHNLFNQRPCAKSAGYESE